VTQPRIVMYATSWCPYCARARRLLQSKGAQFEEIDIDEQPEARAEMITRSGGRRTVPQIFIGDRHIGGSDDLHALDASGGLDPLLKELK
jgi:glutaredoxin 3